MHRYRTLVGASVIALFVTVAGLGWIGQAHGQPNAKPTTKATTKATPAAEVTFKSQAKEWEVLAFNAIEFDDLQGIASYLWSYRATCEQLESDLARRQCLGLRAMRQQQVSDKTFLLRGDSRSFLARYEAAQKGSLLKVYSCFGCTTTIEAQGQPLYVVGQGDKTVFGTQILGPVIHTAIKPFKSAEEAAQWKQDVVPRLRSEYIVRIPREAPLWSAGGVQGLNVEVLGFRVYDPCTGKMLIAEPKAKSLPRNEQACTGEDLLALQRAREEADKPEIANDRSKLPLRLTPKDIQTALEPTAAAAQECHAIYGVTGEAKFRIKISGEGKVTEIEQTGYFVDTPTGECMEDAIRAARFPETQKDSTTVNYPFVLR